MTLQTIQLETARVLRDNPHLRTLEMREEVVSEVREKIPSAKFSSVERCIRKLQNGLGKYRSNEADEQRKGELEEEYREYFGDRTIE